MARLTAKTHCGTSQLLKLELDERAAMPRCSAVYSSAADRVPMTFAPGPGQSAHWPSCWDISREHLVAHGQVDGSGTPASDDFIPTGRERSAQLRGLWPFPFAVPDDRSLQTLNNQLQGALPLIDVGDIFSSDDLLKLNCTYLDDLKPSHLDRAMEADAHTAHPIASESRQAGWPQFEPVTWPAAATRTSNGALNLLEGAPREPAATMSRSVISRRSIEDPRPLCAAPSESAVTGHDGTCVSVESEQIGVLSKLSSTTSSMPPEGGSSVCAPAAATNTTGLSLLAGGISAAAQCIASSSLASISRAPTPTTCAPTGAPTTGLSVGMPQLRAQPQPQPQPGQE